MTQGELEKIPKGIEKSFSELQIRIMQDIVRRIQANGFSTASADWQTTRLQQLGMSEEQIKAWIRDILNVADEEVDRIYSDDAFEEYMGYRRAYEVFGRQQLDYEENQELQQIVRAVREQTKEALQNLTATMGFVKAKPDGRRQAVPLSEFYRQTLDAAVYDIRSGAFDYNTVLTRSITDMTKSGLQWIDYKSGWHNRIPVAARRAIMTGFRQVQGKINEQVARDLGTDSYEVTVHIGARPTHQPWEGRVWTWDQLCSTEEGMPGLGSALGLHGINCYHDYNPFIPGVSVRTYTDEELDRIHEEENTPKEYGGKEYTTYEALQHQRKLETRARMYREDVALLEEGGGDEDTIIAMKCRYQKTMQEYRAFSKKMGLPMQRERIYQDGLKVDMRAPSKTQKHGQVLKGPVGSRSRLFSDIGDEIRATSEKVYFSNDNDYSLDIDGLNPEVNKALSEIAKDLAKKGSEDGYEHMCLVDIKTGNVVHEECNGDDISVGVDFWKVAGDNEDIDFIYIHNHNYVSSLSETDLTTPVRCKNILYMVAVQNDGVAYVAHRVNDAVQDFYPDFYFDKELEELNQKSRNGIITPVERMQEREKIIIQNLIKTFYGGRVDCFE